MSIQTPLGRVRGLGSAKSGVEHFWAQRATAVALVPLTLWFVWAVASHVGAPHEQVIGFLANPFNATAMVLFVLAGLYHMALGLQIVIEDYVSGEGMKLALLVAVKFAAAAIGAVSVIAVLKIAI